MTGAEPSRSSRSAQYRRVLRAVRHRWHVDAREAHPTPVREAQLLVAMPGDRDRLEGCRGTGAGSERENPRQ